MRKGTVTLAGREKNRFVFSVSQQSVFMLEESKDRIRRHMDVQFYSWYTHLRLWTELLQIKHTRGPGLPLEDAKHEDTGRLVWRKRPHVLWREVRPLSPQTSFQTKAWCLPSASGSRVCIMSWKMLFLMRLLWREAELPPRWRRGLAWTEKPDKDAVSSQKPKASALQVRSSPYLVVTCFCHMITHCWPKIPKVHFKSPKGMAFSQPFLLNKFICYHF